MSMNRRELLAGLDPASASHIASMVVQCLPEKLAATVSALETIPGIEVPERDPLGKMVVLIEVRGENELMQRITEIESTAGVISANLVYHQIDD